MLLDKVKRSITYRFNYQVSPVLSQVMSGMNRGKLGHGPRLTDAQPLLDLGISVEQVSFDIEDCWNFWHSLCPKSQQLEQLVNSESFWQKLPQYYFTWKSLQAILENPQSVYIDIASTVNSPYQQIISLLAKTTNIYTQDLVFPPGINDRQIGGSAAELPLPEASVDAMTLHCAFEHFEGDADTGFVREAGRVLRPGGRVCIVPLYLGEYAFVLCDPAWAFNLCVDSDTVIHFLPRWGERHGRFYDPETLLQRIVEPSTAAGLIVRVIHFTNITELDPDCYTHFGLILEKPL
ncbi:methyltransferase type 11 [Cyanosarcina cf. burmensis CCALA 770]|nr:methyltransferase type 11 [Cyanosarcina cf. burmensis CCALA 770]